MTVKDVATIYVQGADQDKVYLRCRECLYNDARDGRFEHCDAIVIVSPEDCQSDMHLDEDDGQTAELDRRARVSGI